MTNFSVSWKSAGKVNFLKAKVIKRRVWKSLNVLSTLAIVVNTGMVGVLLQPGQASAANQSAKLEQCANDPSPSPSTDGCATSATEWDSGNLGASKSVYTEGDSVPYRILLDNLSIDTHNIIIEWDTTKSSKHALDYITTYNRTVTDANPCLGVSGCGAASTFAIPVDPQVSGGGVTPVAGNLTLFGGTITGVSAYTYQDGAGFSGDKSARITITFTASQANPVLAWGGHIATRADWGAANSAVAISGSPYHTRLIDLDGSGGNQDRSLSADAVIYPGSVTVIKQATPESAQNFAYTTNLGNGFNLVDDGSTTDTKVFSGITDFTDDNSGPATYTVTESALGGWTLNSIACTDPTNNTTVNVGTRTATIEMVEGENISCTFANSGSSSLKIKKFVRNVTADENVASNWYNYDADGQSLPVLPGATVEYKVIVWNDGTAPGNATVSDFTSNAGLYNPNYASSSLYTSVSIPNSNGASMPAVTTGAGTGAYWKIVTYQKAVDSTTTNDGTANSINTAVLNTSINSQAKIEVTYRCDLTITKTVDAVDTQTNTITYKITVANNGTADCTGSGVRIDDTIPANTTYANWHQEGSQYVTFGYGYTTFGPMNSTGFNGTLLSWNAWDLNPQESQWVKFKVNVRSLRECEELDITNTAKAYTVELQTAAEGYEYLQSNTTTTHFAAPCTTTLKVIKHVVNDNGGTKTAADFTMNVNGTNVSDASFPGEESGKTVTLDPGSFSVTENKLAGYADSYSGDCSGNITLGQDLVCTITNDDIAPKLTLVKTVINDNGGNAQPNEFNLSIGGTATLSGDPMTVEANKAYALNETSVSGYTFVSITGDEKCPTYVGGSITLDEGDDITCTFTNDDIAPKLTLVKTVTNDNGGNAQPNDFNLTIGGAATLSGVAMPVQANTPYALNETQLTGQYAFVSITGDKRCPAILGSTISLNEGEDVTCTITNDDIQPKLTVTKFVTNDNGGTKQVSDFSLFVDATPVTSGVQNGFNAATYIVSETNIDGYAAVISGDCAIDGSITLQPGDVKSCVITNNDVTAHLKLTKHVTKDNGGNDVAGDWTLTATGTTPLQGAGTAESDVDAGTYTLSENGPSGYTPSAWSCTGGNLKGDELTLGVGESASCEITNDDVAPTITLTKVVNTNYGGTAGVNDFGLTIGGTAVYSGETLNVAANTPIALNEAGLPKYNFVSITGDEKCPAALNGTVTLGEGETLSCTITNEDTPATISGFKYDWDTENKLDGWEICLQASQQSLLVDSVDYLIQREKCVITGDGEWPTGYYEFTGLSENTYTIYEHVKYGWTQMEPNDPNYHTVVIGTGDVANGKDFWNRKNTFDVTIDKVAAATVQAGANLTYTLNWSVTGNTPVEVKLFDELPANTSFVSATNDGFLDGNTVRWNLGTFNPSANGSVTLTVKVNSPLDKGTVISNTGNICGLGAISEGEPFLSDSQDLRRQKCDDDTTTTTVASAPLLGIAKVANPTTVGGNQDVTYTITWSVAGNSKAVNVVVTDPIPAQTTYVSMGCGTTTGTCTMSTTGTPVTSTTWNLGIRNPGEGGTLTLVVKTAISVPNGSVIPNKADIRSTEVDPLFAQADVTAATAPQLQITKTANATIVNPGDPITYTVKVKNIGTDTAVNAVMTDTLPAGFTFVTTNPTATSIVGQTGTWNLGDMAVGAEKTITYTVNVAPGTTAGLYDNIAKAKANNASEVSAKAFVETRVPQVLGEQTAPVLQLRKTVSKATVAPGDTVTYTVEIKNTGTGSAINVILTDLLPVGFTFKGTDLTTKEWKLGDLAVGETKTVTYQATVGASVPNGSYENLVIAQADNHGKVTTSVPVQVKRGRVLAEVVETGASAVDLAVAGAGLSLIVLGYVLTRRKRGEELA